MEPTDVWNRDRNCFSARYKIAPEHRERFIKLMDELLVFAEDYYKRGCTFAFHGWGRDPNERFIVASWDEDVVQELRRTEEFQRLNSAMIDCCDGPLIMEQFNGVLKDRSVFDIYPAGRSDAHRPGSNNPVVFL